MFLETMLTSQKSLAFTLREILNNLPYQPQPGLDTVDRHIFKTSLIEAISLFSASRKEALAAVYKSKELSVMQDIPIAADFEEVAASCGQFVSSLQDFAEHCVKYMEVLEELHDLAEMRGRDRLRDHETRPDQTLTLMCFLKPSLSSTMRSVCSSLTMVADLTESYKSASSPKALPFSSLMTSF